MGSINIIKPLSAFLISPANKSQQHQEKNYWEHPESDLGPLGVKISIELCGPLQACLGLSKQIQTLGIRTRKKERWFSDSTLKLGDPDASFQYCRTCFDTFGPI